MKMREALHTVVLNGDLNRTVDGRQLTKDEYAQLRKLVAESFITIEFFYCEVRSNKLIVGWLMGAAEQQEMYDYITHALKRLQKPDGLLAHAALDRSNPVKEITVSYAQLTQQQQLQYVLRVLHYAHRGLQHAEFATDTQRRRWWGGLRWRGLGRRDTQELNERLARDTEVLRLAQIGMWT